LLRPLESSTAPPDGPGAHETLLLILTEPFCSLARLSARCPIGHDEGGRWPERRQARRIPRTAWVIWGVSTFGARAARAKARQVSARPVLRLVLRVSVCRTFRSAGLQRASLRAFLLHQPHDQQMAVGAAAAAAATFPSLLTAQTAVRAALTAAGTLETMHD